MKIKRIQKVTRDHTWDVSSQDECYILSNGIVSHNTSSLVTNSTNGVEPPRALVSYKQSKDGVIAQVVPEIRRLKNKYDLLWDQKSPIGYLKIMAVLQKFVDQSISVNTSYNLAHYPNHEIPMSELLQHVLLSYKFGLKNLYYLNSHDQAGEVDTSTNCESCAV